MNDLISVNYSAENPTISARELHQFLEVATPFDKWFPRMCSYGFSEGLDFSTFLSGSTGGRPAQEADVTISMAKELCMIQRTEIGKKARQYFISIENAWNTPEMVMSRAIKMAENKISALQLDNSKLLVANATMQPKAAYFDALVDKKLLTNFRDTAKELFISQKDFITSLISQRYIYRDYRGVIKPYADKNNGLFEIKEVASVNSEWAGIQTFITPKGRETFRLLLDKGVSVQ